MMFDHLFLDLDGTVYISGILIDTVQDEIWRLHRQGVAVHFLTNNTSLSVSEYLKKLETLSLPAAPDNIITPTLVAAPYFNAAKEYSKIFLVGTQSFSDEFLALSNCEFDDTNPDAILIAFDRELTYAKLETASKHINRDIPYYLTHIDSTCPTAEGPIPDCGLIGKLLEATTRVGPAGHFGKPSDALVAFIKKLILPGETALLAGDRLYTDGRLGTELGIETLIVRSGEFRGAIDDVPAGFHVSETLAAYLRDIE